MQPSLISVALVERNALFREGIKSFLAETDFMVKAEFGCMNEFVNALEPTLPDIIIVGVNLQSCDLPMAKFDEQIRQIRDCCEAKLVIITSIEGIHYMPELLQSNVDGYIMQDISRSAMLSYLNLAMMGEKAIPEAIRLVCDTPAPSASPVHSPRANGLSERENDIVDCLVLGESNKLIARRLEITESTVKVHLKAILRKMGVSNRTQAALIASQRKIPYFNKKRSSQNPYAAA